MTSKINILAQACALLALSATAVALGADEGTDDLGVDFYQQNDFYTNALNLPESTTGFYERQVNWMLENQYPPASIMMSSVSRGMTLADTTFFMARAKPEQAEEIYELAVDVMPAMPGWACSSAGGLPNRYDRGLSEQELPPNPSLEQLAETYFDDGKRFMEYPEWEQGQGHVDITLDELIRFKEQDIEENGQDSWWYRPDQRVETDVIMASLYPSNRRVAIDARLEELQKMKNSGSDSVPVMLLYTEEGQIPMSDFTRDPDDEEDASGKRSSSAGNYDDQEITASDVIARFDSTGERASPTRDWHKGDHHLRVDVSELQSLFEVPEKDDIEAADWQRWEQQLDKGLEKPLLISMYEGAADNRWLDEKGLVAVAAERDMEKLPVVFFYHSSQRQPCGLPAACTDQLKEAIIKGSGRDDLVLGARRPPGQPAGQGRPLTFIPPPSARPASPN